MCYIYMAKEFDVNDWKELQIDNLPPDILTGDYEFTGISGRVDRFGIKSERVTMLKWMVLEGTKYRYRKPEPKAPTHEEIMTKWWRRDKNKGWIKIEFYHPENYTPYSTVGLSYSNPTLQEYTKEAFIGMESADIPPEEPK